ncbi:MAG: hypothetical protein CM15mP23_02290 [Cryomorphaceae bacterium]|nr:MAG: hypothetical protein CM15mP23_02290 [Cryomorphaceae bacterium]
MKRFYMFFMLYSTFAIAQVEQPRLVVGVVVDQMRFDYINRYWNDMVMMVLSV